MIFSALYDSWKNGELLLIDGGYCRWHLKKDGQLTIYEIIATRKGAGKEMLEVLKLTGGASSVFAKCPSELLANDWYEKRGFVCEGEEQLSGGTKVKLWRLHLD